MELVVRAARERQEVLGDLCANCLAAALDDMMELPAYQSTCRMSLAESGSESLERLRLALLSDTPERVAGELAQAVEELDCPLVRTGIAVAVLELEDSRRCRAEVAAVALDDLARKGPSALVVAALAVTVAGEVDVPLGLPRQVGHDLLRAMGL